MKQIYLLLAGFLFLILPARAFSFGKNKVSYHPYSWSVILTPHYRLYLPSHRLFLSNEIVERAESIWKHHSKVFGYSPSNRIRVVIYPNQIDFQQNKIVPGWIGEGTGGITEFVKGRVLLPYSARGDYFQHVFAHEMTHVFQGLRWGKGRLSQNSIRSVQVPLWMIEGMAEYNSIGLDQGCETIIADGILSGNLPDLKQLSDPQNLNPSQYYFIYKEGQFFYYFLEQTFGSSLIEKINDLIMVHHELEGVISNAVGISFEELNTRFMDFVKRRYFPQISNLSSPDIVCKKLIEKNSALNMNPVMLDENRSIFISDRKLIPSIVLYDSQKKRLETLISGIFDENYLEFHFGERTHLSLTSNGQTLCFVSRTGGEDRIHLFDLKSRQDRILDSSHEMIQSPDISPDGRFVAYSAMDNAGFDIFVTEVSTGKTLRITKDRAYDNQPRWIDKQTLAFSSSRYYPKDSSADILLINIKTKKIIQRINSGYRDIYPVVSKDQSKLAFVSEEVHPTLFVYDLKKNKAFRQFSPTGACYAPSFSPKGDLIFSAYQKGSYNLYRFTPSLEQPVELKEESKQKPETRPDFPNIKKTVIAYSPEFSIDNLFGGLTFNSALGLSTIGMIHFSDLMGNHRARLMMDSSIDFSHFNPNHFNADFSYVYLKNRLNIGFRLYHYSNYFYQLSTFQTFFNIEKPYTRTWAVFLNLSYPFSTFDRLESTVGLQSFDFIQSVSTNISNTLVFQTLPQDRNLIKLDFVHDSTLNDVTGPVGGTRYQISLSASLPFSEHAVSYLKAIFDYRAYLYLLPGYSVAFRGVGGRIETSDTNSFFQLGGFNSLRGYDLWSFSGNALALFNLELRFPLIFNWKLGFPFQIPLPTIWGTLFVDTGTTLKAGDPDYQAWIVQNGVIRLKDWHCGIGGGIRVILIPQIKIMVDWAQPYDLTGIDLTAPWKTTFQIGIDF